LLLDNEKGGDSFPLAVEGRTTSPSRRRAVLVGQVWSADLAETLMEVYGPLINAGWTLEDLSRMVLETSDDRSGD